MRHALAFCLALGVTTVAGPSHAQEDEGRIVRFIEAQLSDGGARQVDLQGFRGALSSTAELDRLVISDSEGPWLILEDAQFTWSRASLLRGALSIEEISAGRLTIERAPISQDDGLDLPPAEATPFSLPDLPVSIDIDRAAIDEVRLGADFLGMPVAFSVDGDAELMDGAGNANLEVIRIDGPDGRFDLNAAYSNETRNLVLSLIVAEDAGGLAASLLNIPDEPSIELSVVGEGPIDDFSADIALATGGEPRVTGAITTALDAETQVRSTDANIDGDISPLLIPDYRQFFGDSVTFDARIVQDPNAGISIETLDLRSAALTLTGDLSLAPGGRPQAFDFTGRIADRAGKPVRLPIPGAEVEVAFADLILQYDAAAGDTYDARVIIADLATDGVDLGRISLDVGGMISEDTTGLAVSSSLSLDVTGIGLEDAILADTIGDVATLRGEVSWLQGAPIFLSDLSIQSGDVALEGTAAVGFDEAQIALTTDLTATVADLSRFAAISGLPLEGQITTSVAGTAELLSGAFDLRLDGQAQNLILVDGINPALTAGETNLAIAARRDETGISLSQFDLDGTEVSLQASGQVSANDGALTAQADLRNLGLLVSALPGPASADLTLERGSDGAWSTQADITGPQGITANVAGRVGLPDNAVDIRASGGFPLSLASPLLQPRSIVGSGQFDLTVSGQPGLDAVRGQITASGIRMSLPTLQTAFENGTASAQINGGSVAFRTSGALAAGGTVSTDGTINIASPSLPATINVTGRSLRLIDPTLYNALIESVDLRVSGALAGSLRVAGAVVLGETELLVPETGLGGAVVPDIRHIGETAAERRTRAAAGLLQTSAPGGSGSQQIGLDISVSAPGRVFIRGRGLDAELGGNLRLGGTTANIIPSGQFDLIRGRFAILGTRLDLTEGSAFLRGSFTPFVRLVASSRSGSYTVLIEVEGPITEPEITFSSDPSLPEDEVLAQLLFGRSVSALSPLQLLQMADAAASLVGGSSNGGLVAGIRDGLGLDDLDLQTDAEGNAAVRAGRYLSENVYADVTVGSEETDLSLNIDLTPNITARGSFSSEGSSSLGVFFERDY